MSEATKNTSAAADDDYFKEYVKGVGYLNSLKSTTNDRFAVKIAAFQGRPDDMHYEYHDLIVGSTTALSILHEYIEEIENEDIKVIIRFNFVNPRANPFMFKNGERAGQPGASIGGILTRVMSLKVDGEDVYKDERTFDDSQQPKKS